MARWGTDTRRTPCHLAGGGTVLLPAGVYLSGTVTLKDNVCFELAPPGATVATQLDE